MQQEAIEVGKRVSNYPPARATGSNKLTRHYLATEAMEKYHIEKASEEAIWDDCAMFVEI